MMSVTDSQPRNESTNWLTVYPAKRREQKLVNRIEQTLGDFPDTQHTVMALSQVLETGVFQGKKLSGDDLAIIQKVFNFITEGVKLGIDEAVSLKLRQITDTEKKRILNEQQEKRSWSFYSGDYRGPLIQNDTPPLHGERKAPHEQPGDIVHFLRKRIEQLLEHQTDKPVVMIDIGAMYGTTLLELADQFREAILAGKLLLIGTNIGLTKQALSDEKPINGSGLNPVYQSLYEKAGHLVQFLTTDVPGLFDTAERLILPNGEVFHITPGSIDIVHENFSISKHSKSLEYDAALIAKLIGSRGIIMSNRTGQTELRRGPGGLSASHIKSEPVMNGSYALGQLSNAPLTNLYEGLEKYPMKDIIDDQLIRVSGTFKNHGLELIEQIQDSTSRRHEELNYSFWIGKNADPLVFFDQLGNEIRMRKTQRNAFPLKLRNFFSHTDFT